MATKFAREIKRMAEQELGEKVSAAWVDREVEGFCFQFWSMADAEGLELAVRMFPDVAAHLAANVKRADGTADKETRRKLRTLLNPPAPPAAPARSKEQEIDEAAELLDWAEQSYAETYAEHRSETARFGDSWPGAQLQLADMRAGIAEADATLWRVLTKWAELPEHGPPVPARFDPLYDDGDEPF